MNDDYYDYYYSAYNYCLNYFYDDYDYLYFYDDEDYRVFDCECDLDGEWDGELDVDI